MICRPFKYGKLPLLKKDNATLYLLLVTVIITIRDAMQGYRLIGNTTDISLDHELSFISHENARIGKVQYEL